MGQYPCAMSDGNGNGDGRGIGRRAFLRGALRAPPPVVPVVRPPGAVAPARFDALCDGCGGCEEACPAQAIAITGPETGIGDVTPEIVAVQAPCVMCEGLVCASSCPTGALAPITAAQMRIATIAFRTDACLAARGIDPGCDDCFERCPLKGTAITYRRGAGPEIHPEACTGCGVCVHYCPSAPKALTVQAI